MDRVLTGLRSLRAGLAALVLAALVFGPGLDAIICHDEAGLSAAAAELPADDAASGQVPDGHEGEAPGACAHGHCHHPGGSTPPPPWADSSRHGADAGHAPPRGRVTTSDSQFDLMRPPKA